MAKQSFFSKIADKTKAAIQYCTTGVWQSTSDSFKTKSIKVINLALRSFMDRDLQSRSMSLTYSTVLAIVPAFALLFAIGRGFGFQDLLEQELYKSFPAQQQFIKLALRFVDSYLKEASQGIIVGIGIVFLLWTLISLLSYIEEAFNNIWDIKRDRSFYQKITDYVAICLMVPVLMICSAGVSIFMSATIQDNMHFPFLTPVVNTVLECMPLILSWLAFTLSFFLIPNTKVNFKYAAISGAVCAVVFQILETMFVNGQIYVAKYNAIYGSFAFLPLLLIWLQFSWLLLLFGCVLTYSLQNVTGYNFLADIHRSSNIYRRKIALVVTTAVWKSFHNGEKAPTVNDLSQTLAIPQRIVKEICDTMHNTGIFNFVEAGPDSTGMAPGPGTDSLSVGELFKRLDSYGDSGFIPGFRQRYKTFLDQTESWFDKCYDSLSEHRISELTLPTPYAPGTKPEKPLGN